MTIPAKIFTGLIVGGAMLYLLFGAWMINGIEKFLNWTDKMQKLSEGI